MLQCLLFQSLFLLLLLRFGFKLFGFYLIDIAFVLLELGQFPLLFFRYLVVQKRSDFNIFLSLFYFFKFVLLTSFFILSKTFLDVVFFGFFLQLFIFIAVDLLTHFCHYALHFCVTILYFLDTLFLQSQFCFHLLLYQKCLFLLLSFNSFESFLLLI